MRKLYGFAKLNLCLAIEGKRGDSHLIDSVFRPFFFKDELVLERSDKISVIYEDGRKYENDSALRAAEAVAKEYRTGGVRIVIKKGVPEGAGMGGSSVDAGLVARAMKEEFGLPEIPADFLIKLGGDVPYSYAGGCMRVRGTGEILERTELPELHAVVLLPKGKVDTGKCYRLYDEIGGEEGSVDEFLSECKEGTPTPFNALQRAAEVLNPEIKTALGFLKDAGFRCGMSGSGSAVFGIERERKVFEEKTGILKRVAAGYAVYEEKV